MLELNFVHIKADLSEPVLNGQLSKVDKIFGPAGVCFIDVHLDQLDMTKIKFKIKHFFCT